MGFVPGVTVQIEAFLTKKGASTIMNNGIGNIKYFSVSDDASNYVASDKLGYNQVFTLAGKLAVDGKYTSVVDDQQLKNQIFVDNTSETFKGFEGDSGSVVLEEIMGNVSNTNFFGIYSYLVNRTNPTFELNWITDLMLPYGVVDNAIWNTPFNNAGFSNTSISDMNTNVFLIFTLDGTQHAYMDGKTLKVTLPYFTGTTDLYGSYLNVTPNKQYYDSLVSDTSEYISRFGKNVVLLFSDMIQKPNNDATKSWSTGYNFQNAPYSQGNKSIANFVSNAGANRDIAVGIVYLDKGVVVIFNPALVNGYNARTNNDIIISSRNLIKRTVVNFICDLPISKFYRSKNPTFASNNPVRISSIGLYNESKELMAIGRFNSEVEKSSAQRLTFLVKLVI